LKLFGYSNEGRQATHPVPNELAEVTVNATSAELRRMAEFMLFCASEMERMGPKYDHIHLGDRMKEFASSPHLVIMRLEP
jgi:hypothetical protein